MPLDGGVRIDLVIVRKTPVSGSNASSGGGDSIPTAAPDDDGAGGE